MQFDRRLLKNFDWPFLLLLLSIVTIGALVLYSAAFSRPGGAEMFVNHLVRLGLGLGLMAIVLLVDYHALARWSYILFALNVVALLVTDVIGIVGLGARRWLQVGPVSLQPSELFKISLILSLAFYLSQSRKLGFLNGRDLVIPLLMLGFPLILILAQPDLGTAVIILCIFMTVVVTAGIAPQTRRSALRWGLTTVVAAVLVFYFGFVSVERFFKPYQLKRIMVLVNPEIDTLGAGYHINQSKIAIGSGRLSGKGFLNGTQSQLRFLPQQHTDFIFAVLAEEWGFLGVSVVLSLFLGLILMSLRAARTARDSLGSLIALGVAALIFYHTFINIGMAVGMMPVVGLPLPLVSYGGSSAIVILVSIGLLLNVRMRRFVI